MTHRSIRRPSKKRIYCYFDIIYLFSPSFNCGHIYETSLFFLLSSSRLAVLFSTRQMTRKFLLENIAVFVCVLCLSYAIISSFYLPEIEIKDRSSKNTTNNLLILIYFFFSIQSNEKRNTRPKTKTILFDQYSTIIKL